MANLYGLANPVPNLGWFDTIGSANVSCPAGVETNVIQSGALAALDHGVYYPVCWANLVLTMGATQPTNLILGLRLNNGADVANQVFNIPAGSGGLALTFIFIAAGVTMPTAFWPPGSSLQVTANPGTNAITCNFSYSKAILGIFRAADQ